MMIDFKNRNPVVVRQAIIDAGHTLTADEEGNWVCSDFTACQAIIDALPEPMPDLLPVQWGYMLARNGFDAVIDLLLENLKTEDTEKYAMYKAFLNFARFYEFDKTLVMFNEIRQKFTDFNPELDFTTDQLKQMWLAASQV